MAAVVLATLQTGLAALFALAAVAKTLDQRVVRDALVASSVPTSLVSVTSVFLPAIELALAIAVVVAPSGHPLQAAVAATTAALAAFTVWIGWVIHRGISTSCACFGGWGGVVGRMSVIRNGGLLVLSGAAVVLSTVTESALPAFNIWFGSVIVAGITAAGLLFSMIRGLRWLKLTPRAWRGGSDLQTTT